MKFLNLILSLVCVCGMWSCSNEETPTATGAPTANTVPIGEAPVVAPNFGGNPVQGDAAVTPASTNAPAAVQAPPAVNTNIPNYEKFAHFICPKACKGSGAETNGQCPVCGTQYVHNENSDGHRAEIARANAATANKVQMQIKDTLVTVDKPSDYNKKAHYICPKACAGSGSEAPGKCGTCGSELAHNNNSLHHEWETKLGKK